MTFGQRRVLYRHRLFRAYAALGLLAGLVGCAPPPTSTPPPITLRLTATDLAAPLLADLTAAYAPVAPDVTIATTLTSPGRLKTELEAGRADLGLGVNVPTEWFATPLGYLTLTVIVHPNQPLTDLTAAQVTDLFTGRLSDWSQIGLSSGAIHVISREDESDGGRAWAALAVGGLPPTRAAQLAPTWAAMRALVSAEPQAIGYLPQPELDETVRPVNVDGNWRALIVATASAEPTGLARDFLAWVQSPAGQAVVTLRHASPTP